MEYLSVQIIEALSDDPVYGALCSITHTFRSKFPGLPLNVSKMMESLKHMQHGLTVSGKTILLGPEYTITGVDMKKLTDESQEYSLEVNSNFFFEMLSTFPTTDIYSLEEIVFADVIELDTDVYGEEEKIILRRLSSKQYELHKWAMSRKNSDGEWDFIFSIRWKDIHAYYTATNQTDMLKDEKPLTKKNENDTYLFCVESHRLSKLVFRFYIEQKEDTTEEINTI